jgi:hypothetical protein
MRGHRERSTSPQAADAESSRGHAQRWILSHQPGRDRVELAPFVLGRHLTRLPSDVRTLARTSDTCRLSRAVADSYRRRQERGKSTPRQ